MYTQKGCMCIAYQPFDKLRADGVEVDLLFDRFSGNGVIAKLPLDSCRGNAVLLGCPLDEFSTNGLEKDTVRAELVEAQRAGLPDILPI